MNWIFSYIEIRDKEAKISLDRESTKMNFWLVIVARMELFQRIISENYSQIYNC